MLFPFKAYTQWSAQYSKLTSFTLNVAYGKAITTMPMIEAIITKQHVTKKFLNIPKIKAQLSILHDEAIFPASQPCLLVQAMIELTCYKRNTTCKCTSSIYQMERCARFCLQD